VEKWKVDLNNFFRKKAKESQHELEKKTQTHQMEPIVAEFFSSTIAPAFNELKTELEKHGKTVKLYTGNVKEQSIEVYSNYNLELAYLVTAEISPNGVHIYSKITSRDKKDGRRRNAAGRFSHGISNITKEEVIQNFLNYYKRYS
jgi:phosphoserine phosphatase